MLTFGAVVARVLQRVVAGVATKGVRVGVLTELDGEAAAGLREGKVDVLLAAYADDVSIMALDADKAKLVRDEIEVVMAGVGMVLAPSKEEVTGAPARAELIGAGKVVPALRLLGVPVSSDRALVVEAVRERIRATSAALETYRELESPLAELYLHRVAGLPSKLQWLLRALPPEVIRQVEADVREAERGVAASLLRCGRADLRTEHLIMVYTGTDRGGLGLRSLLRMLRADVGARPGTERAFMDAEELAEVESLRRELREADDLPSCRRLASLARTGGRGSAWLSQAALVDALDPTRSADEEALVLRRLVGVPLSVADGAKCPGGHAKAVPLGPGAGHLTMCASLVTNQRHNAARDALAAGLRRAGHQVVIEQSVAKGGGAEPRGYGQRGAKAPGDVVVTLRGPAGRRVWCDIVVKSEAAVNLRGEELACDRAFDEKMAAHRAAIAKASSPKCTEREREEAARLAAIVFLPIALDSHGGVSPRTLEGLERELGIPAADAAALMMEVSREAVMRQARGLEVARLRMAALRGEPSSHPLSMPYEVYDVATDEDEGPGDGAAAAARPRTRSRVAPRDDDDDDDDDDDGGAGGGMIRAGNGRARGSGTAPRAGCAAGGAAGAMAAGTAPEAGCPASTGATVGGKGVGVGGESAEAGRGTDKVGLATRAKGAARGKKRVA